MQWSKSASTYPEFIKKYFYRVLIGYTYKPNCNSCGAGFFIADNLFITCAHVIFGGELVNIRKNNEFAQQSASNEHERLLQFYKNKKPIIKIEISDGIKVDAELKDFDELYDIALLEVEVKGNKINKCALDLTGDISYGSPIAFGGFPDQFSYTYDKTPFAYHEGIVSSFPETVIGGDKYEHLQINSINLSGNSGAPLFIKGEKKVIGIINGNMNWGRDDLLAADNKVVSNRIPLSIAYATTMKMLKDKTKILTGVV